MSYSLLSFRMTNYNIFSSIFLDSSGFFLSHLHSCLSLFLFSLPSFSCLLFFLFSLILFPMPFLLSSIPSFLPSFFLLKYLNLYFYPHKNIHITTIYTNLIISFQNNNFWLNMHAIIFSLITQIKMLLDF
jgi:hypothetical protein